MDIYIFLTKIIKRYIKKSFYQYLFFLTYKYAIFQSLYSIIFKKFWFGNNGPSLV